MREIADLLIHSKVQLHDSAFNSFIYTDLYKDSVIDVNFIMKYYSKNKYTIKNSPFEFIQIK